jgi:hypothetical protein
VLDFRVSAEATNGTIAAGDHLFVVVSRRSLSPSLAAWTQVRRHQSNEFIAL